MIDLEALGGTLFLRPGVAVPGNITSTRRDWVAQLAPGTAASALPDLLARLFAVCAPAHRLCASMSVAAARQQQTVDPSTHAAALLRLTLSEHLRAIGLDWPRRLTSLARTDAAIADGQHLLAQWAAIARDGQSDALVSWMQESIFQLPLGDWLLHWQSDPAGWLEQWCSDHRRGVAGLLHDCRLQADRVLPHVAALRITTPELDLPALAKQLAHHGSAFTRAPTWHSGCAQTGSWTRTAGAGDGHDPTPLTILASRLADVARLALAAQRGETNPSCLAMGALPLGKGEGIAWLEMARGLLIHHVVLRGAHGSERIDACHVLAPTEWNFHAQGVVAQALAAMPDDQAREERRDVAILVAAFDPCVTVQIEPRRA